MKLPSKTAPGATETRYFTAIDGLMDGNADVILKETRQGKAVTAAVLDVCYPAAKGSDRKDRFVANLAVLNGQNLTGTTQSLGDKQPVIVKLARKPFGVRVKLDAALDFLKSLKGEAVEVGLSSLSISCDALRAGEQTINLTADPERTAALIAKAKSMPGVVAAGWTSGSFEMDRTIRFAAAEWRDGDKINKEKIASAISAVLSKTLAAKAAGADWDPNTGKLTLTLKRPSPIYPPLGLTESVEVTALVSPDKPGASDKLMLWISSPVITTADEGTGPKLSLSEESTGDEEGGEPKDDNGSVEALAKEFKGQRWDADRSVWK
jgi:hypothetical protein